MSPIALEDTEECDDNSKLRLRAVLSLSDLYYWYIQGATPTPKPPNICKTHFTDEISLKQVSVDRVDTWLLILEL